VGVLRGGKLIQKLRRIRVKGMVDDMPEFIEIDISDIDIGNSVKIRDLKLEKLVLLDPTNSVIVRVKTARVVEEEVEEEEEVEGEEGAEAPAEGGEAPAAEAEQKKEESSE
jgi:large subunit ribosomal protein L25